MKSITGFWKNKSKNGLSYYKSPKLSAESIALLKEALNSGEEVSFLIFNNASKEEGSNAPDINLVIGENKLTK